MGTQQHHRRSWSQGPDIPQDSFCHSSLLLLCLLVSHTLPAGLVLPSFWPLTKGSSKAGGWLSFKDSDWSSWGRVSTPGLLNAGSSHIKVWKFPYTVYACVWWCMPGSISQLQRGKNARCQYSRCIIINKAPGYFRVDSRCSLSLSSWKVMLSSHNISFDVKERDVTLILVVHWHGWKYIYYTSACKCFMWWTCKYN